MAVVSESVNVNMVVPVFLHILFIYFRLNMYNNQQMKKYICDYDSVYSDFMKLQL